MRRWVDSWIGLHCIGMGLGYSVGIARCFRKIRSGYEISCIFLSGLGLNVRYRHMYFPHFRIDVVLEFMLSTRHKDEHPFTGTGALGSNLTNQVKMRNCKINSHLFILRGSLGGAWMNVDG